MNPLVVLFAQEAVDMAISVLRHVHLENCSDFQTDILSQYSRDDRRAAGLLSWDLGVSGRRCDDAVRVCVGMKMASGNFLLVEMPILMM